MVVKIMKVIYMQNVCIMINAQKYCYFYFLYYYSPFSYGLPMSGQCSQVLHFTMVIYFQVKAVGLCLTSNYPLPGLCLQQAKIELDKAHMLRR